MSEGAAADLEIEGLTDAVAIGVGGFATVYRAYQAAFRRTVAVKVLATSNLDDASRERFERECQAMGSLSDHPNIVTVYGAGFTGGSQSRPYLVMAYLPDGSLAERISEAGPLAWQDATLYGVHLAGALETAHRAGVVHRDIKPANVLMSNFGDALLTDFGIARISGGHETRSGVITASMHHAPPEVIDGQRPTVAGDVYSLASTVYELIVGRAPFEQPGEEGMVPMIRRILTDPPPDLRPLGVPEQLCVVLERSLAKDPAQRPDSAMVLGRELQAARRAAGLEGGKLTVPREAEDALDGSQADNVSFVAAPSQVLCQHCHGPLPAGVDACPRCGAPTTASPVQPAAGAAVPGAPTSGQHPGAAPLSASAPTIASGGWEHAAAHEAGTGQEPGRDPARGRAVRYVVAAAVVLLALGVGATAVVLLSGDDESTELATGADGADVEDRADTDHGGTTAGEEGDESLGDLREEGDYTTAVQDNFINACSQSEGMSRNLCRCVFSGIRESIPFDEFVEMEAALRDGDDAAQERLVPIVQDCADEFGQSSEAPPDGEPVPA